MNTSAIIIYATEALHIKLGKDYFVHSVKEKSYYVPLANVVFSGTDALWIKMGSKEQCFLLNSEIKEVHFV